jgi:hypothetical protein
MKSNFNSDNQFVSCSLFFQFVSCNLFFKYWFTRIYSHATHVRLLPSPASSRSSPADDQPHACQFLLGQLGLRPPACAHVVKLRAGPLPVRRSYKRSRALLVLFASFLCCCSQPANKKYHVSVRFVSKKKNFRKVDRIGGNQVLEQDDSSCSPL